MSRKRRFYEIHSQSYDRDDREAAIRYRRALEHFTFDSDRRYVIAELGCKFAAVRTELDRRGVNHEYVGIDLDEAVLRSVDWRANDCFIVADADDGLPSIAKDIDLFIATEVLEHVGSPLETIGQMADCLSSDGKILVTVPNPYYWGEVLQNWRQLPDTEGHLSTITNINIDAICRFAGLRYRRLGGTFVRVPFTKRLIGEQALIEVDSILWTRSVIFELWRTPLEALA